MQWLHRAALDRGRATTVGPSSSHDSGTDWSDSDCRERPGPAIQARGAAVGDRAHRGDGARQQRRPRTPGAVDARCGLAGARPGSDGWLRLPATSQSPASCRLVHRNGGNRLDGHRGQSARLRRGPPSHTPYSARRTGPHRRAFPGQTPSCQRRHGSPGRCCRNPADDRSHGPGRGRSPCDAAPLQPLAPSRQEPIHRADPRRNGHGQRAHRQGDS